jgi:hypothetical protein
MQRCPLPYAYNNQNTIEGFANQCPPSSEDGGTSNNNWYSKVRTQNIENVDALYNDQLQTYLNAYNKYLTVKSLLNNTPPNSSQAKSMEGALNEAQHDYTKAQSVLSQYQSDIENNNKTTNGLIKEQTNDIENKTLSIQKKNQLINKQTNLIDERNQIMNSRVRQIELGVSKNVYKRNIMYFLIFVNVLVVSILLGIIYKGK